jgi:hypothetical protein
MDVPTTNPEKPIREHQSLFGSPTISQIQHLSMPGFITLDHPQPTFEMLDLTSLLRVLSLFYRDRVS